MNTQPAMLSAVIDQFQVHWDHQLKDRLMGLTDAEYYFDPTNDSSAWTVHPASEHRTAKQAGAGDTVIDFDFPEPTPAPLTTAAWRLGHVIVGILAIRSHIHLDGPEASYQTWAYSPTAAGAMAQLQGELDRWFSGIAQFDDARLAAPCGPAEGPWGDRPMLNLLLHINRELIHHLSEVALLRDLYAHSKN